MTRYAHAVTCPLYAVSFTDILIVEMVPLWLPIILAPLVLLIRLMRNRGPLPPGPPRKPIIGNLFDVPLDNPFAAFEAWRKRYGILSCGRIFRVLTCFGIGDVVYLRILGNSIVVLNSMNSIRDLFERRAYNYSHRPTFTMVGELMGLDRVSFQHF